MIKPIPIRDFVDSAARRVILKILWLALAIVIPSATAFTLWADLNSTTRVLGALERQLATALEIGDSFQIERIAASIASQDRIIGVEVYARKHSAPLASTGSPLQSDLISASGFVWNGLRSGFQVYFPVSNSSHELLGSISIRVGLPYSSIAVAVLLLAVGLILLQGYIAKLVLSVSKEIVDPIMAIPEALKGKANQESLKFIEIASVLNEINDLRERERELEKVRAIKQQQETVVRIAAQVAHDIRSPLSALNIGLSKINSGSPEAHMLLSNSVKRISTIADSLLRTAKEEQFFSRMEPPNDSFNANSKSIETIGSLIIQILDEKLHLPHLSQRISFNVNIEEIRNCLVFISSQEFMRAFSNLINNSIEAISGNGMISITGRMLAPKKLDLFIKDTGKGIPTHLLSDVGKLGVTHGKPFGNGLGLHYARATIESSQGTFSIQDSSNEGTTVRITLPFIPSEQKSSELSSHAIS